MGCVVPEEGRRRRWGSCSSVLCWDRCRVVELDGVRTLFFCAFVKLMGLSERHWVAFLGG